MRVSGALALLAGLILTTTDAHAQASLEETWTVDPGRWSTRGGAGEGDLRWRVGTDLWHDQLGAFDVNGAGDQYEYGQIGAARLRLSGDMALVKREIFLHAELDVFAGRTYGSVTDLGTDLVDQPLREGNRFQSYPVLPRRLSLEWQTPVGVLEVGHQTSHWGLGILANAGERDGRLFGDATRGNIAERILFATAPGIALGAEPDSFFGRVNLVLAGDLVFSDDIGELLDPEDLERADTAYQAVGGLFLRSDKPGQGQAVSQDVSGGAYVVYRDQEYAEGDDLNAWIVDGHLRYVQRWARIHSLRYEVEAAWINGETNRLITERGRTGVDVESFGSALELEYRWQAKMPLAVMGLAGVASGDGDPDDDQFNAFSFHADYDVGLIYFNHVLPAMQRASVESADDPLRVARTPQGLESYAGRGAFTGATYVGLRAAVEPVERLEVGLQYVGARANAPVSDPYSSFTAGGAPRNTFGGDGEGWIGHEIDAALRYRHRLNVADGLQLTGRLTYGVFLPGEALEGPEGELGTVQMLQLKLALDYNFDGGA